MKGLLFDLDGTLLDSMGVWVRLADDYLKYLGVTPPVDLKKQIKAMTLKEAMAHFKEQFALDIEVEQMLQDAHRMLTTYYHTTISVKPHVRDTLDMLRREGYRMAVATATSDDLSVPAIEHHGLARYFDFVHTPLNSGYSKMEKEYWLAGAERMGIPPENIVVFEDALHGIKTAKACGMRIIAIEDESALRDRKEIKVISDNYLTEFSEFRLEMLNR